MRRAARTLTPWVGGGEAVSLRHNCAHLECQPDGRGSQERSRAENCAELFHLLPLRRCQAERIGLSTRGALVAAFR